MKTKNLFLTVLLCLLGIVTTNAGIRFVKPDGTGTGASWADAAGTILPSSLADGDIIFIAAGTYSITNNLVINKNNVSIYGACAGTENDVNELAAVPDTVANKTIIQYTGAASGTARVITATGNNVLIQGCHITGGNLSGSNNGGGILIEYGTIRYCTVYGNKASTGGGIRVNGNTSVSSTIENCIVRNNEAANGGGINLNKNTTVVGCIIKNNTASGGSGGIYSAGGGNEIIDRCVIDGNIASSSQGGGAGINNAKMTNCLVINNHASSNGGGIRTNGNSNPVYVYNVTVANNTSAGSGAGGGISSQNVSHKIINSIIWGNTANGVANDLHGGNADSRTSCIYSGASGTGNINADPLFADAAQGDYTLLETSPARGAGDTSVGLTVDLIGTPRGTGTIDIGAYEYKTPLPKEDTPTATIDYEAETLTGLTASADYTINSANYTADGTGIIVIEASWLGTTLSIVKKGDNTSTSNSVAQALDIPARPAAPTVDVDEYGITGTTTDMEYESTGSGSWADCTATLTVIATAGNYDVRLKAVASVSFAGEKATVQVTLLPKEVTPAAAIDYEAETLTGLTASADYTIGSADYTADTEGAIAIDVLWLETTLSIVKKGDNTNTCNSNPQSLDIPARPAEPTVDVNEYNITGTTTAMEYVSTGGGSWADCSETETTVASLDYYYVRLKAVVGESFAGESTTVQVTGLRKEDIPAAAIDYEAETLTGLTASADYTINSTDYTSDTEGAIAIDASWLGTTLSIVKKGDNSVTCNSNPQSLDIPARPAAPTGVTGSVVKIKGTTLAMEYSETGVDTWADCSATATAVAAGSYDIRLKAVADESFAGTTTTVTVLVETIRYVKPGGAGSGDGSSWADAAASILPATLAVGDIIFVAAGTYTITTSLVINKEDVSIYGACAGTETSVSHLAAVPDTVNNPTVIQYTGAADGNGRVINATGINVLIQGFHITGGNQSSGNGGGIQIENGTIRYCTVYGNKAPNGGGIRVNNANATIFSTIENCIVRNNEATTGSGGGINISRNTTIVGCIIKNNTAGGGSGGIHTSGGGDEIIDRCVIDSNETAAGKDGGGLTLNKTLLTNSLIINNKSGRGGGMRIGGSSNVSSIYNCTIADNEIGTTSGGGAVSSQATSNIMKNCIVWNNKRNVNGTVTGDNINSISILSYSICNDAGGSDNTTADPLFTDAANGQYTIKRKSPARGAGDFSVNLTTDLIGTPRGTETIDIGAYEYLYPSWLPKETTPTVAINYVDEMLMRLTASADYFLGGTEYIANGPVSIDEAWFGTTLSIVKAGDEVITSHSEAQLLDIPARPAAPAVTGGIIKINGTTTDMEYVNAAGGSWASCSNGSTAVEEGDYFVRVKAIAYEGFSGESASIHVDGLTPEITPNVAIDYINETLINFVPLSEHQVSLTTFYSISEEGMIEIEPEWMGTTVMIVKNGDYVITSNSEPQWLEIPARPAAPAVTGGILQIEGTSAAMEYASAGGGDWADCSDGSTALAEGEYIVRVKAAADENFVGATVSVQVVGLTQEATPAAAIDYIRETLTGLTASAEYLIDGTDYTADAEGILSIDASWLGTTLSIVKKGDGASTYSSEAQSLVVPARPAAPTVTGGITQIEGTSAAMEYASAADGTWAPCSDGSTAVEAGEYLVRLKAVAGVSFAGATTPVRVEPVNGLAEVAAGKALFRYLPDAREIVVDNVTNTSIAVYDITGICIVRKEAATRISTAGWAKGVYIVKAGNKTAKLLVR